jgi:dsRNA-specific ribonuclease
VRVSGEVVGHGEGKSKREAEQIAATLAFTTLSGRA